MNDKRSRIPSGVVLSIAFLSGFAALLYQMVWIRKFGLVFGVQVLSLSAVLTAFMTGLALGSYGFGKLADRVKRTYLLLLFIESGLALFAFGFPFLFGKLEILYKIVCPDDPSRTDAIQGIRFVFAFIFLLIPCLLMGGTLPVLSRMVIRNIGSLGRDFSKLYAANNLGAFFGCFLTGFLFIKNFGVPQTIWIGTILNLSIILAITVTRGTWKNIGFADDAAIKTGERTEFKVMHQGLVRTLLWVFALEGFTTLGFEVLWTRILVEYSYDKTVYLYTVIIMSFIGGLSLGSYLISKFIDRLESPAAFLGYTELLIGLVSLMLLFLTKRTMPALMLQRESLESWYELSGREYLLIFAALSVPVVLMGMTFPLVGRVYANTLQKLGNRIGFLGFLDTIGSVAGSVITGFLLIPVLGVSTSFIIMVVVNLILGSVVILKINEYSVAGRTITISLTVLVFCGFIMVMPRGDYFKSKAAQIPEQKIYYYREGAGGTVTVQGYELGYKALSINGALFAYNTIDDLRSHRILGYMPFFFQPDSPRVLVIGYGMGITASCFRYDDIKQLHVAEICSPVFEASSMWFSHLNHDILEDSVLQIIADDGRSWLQLTARQYDIITCDANHPRHSTNLFTKEFFSICKSRLSENGVMCHWMPVNWLTEHEYKTVLRAFIDVFGNSSLWYVNRGVTLIVGTVKPLKIDLEKMKRWFNQKGILEDLRETDILSPEMLLARLCMDKNQLAQYCNGITPNSDDHPGVEFGKVASMSPNVDILMDIQNTRPGYSEIIMYPDQDLQTFNEQVAYYSEIVRQEINRDIVNLRHY